MKTVLVLSALLVAALPSLAADQSCIPLSQKTRRLQVLPFTRDEMTVILAPSEVYGDNYSKTATMKPRVFEICARVGVCCIGIQRGFGYAPDYFLFQPVVTTLAVSLATFSNPDKAIAAIKAKNFQITSITHSGFLELSHSCVSNTCRRFHGYYRSIATGRIEATATVDGSSGCHRRFEWW
jgi:hypothetical protein